MSIKTQKIIRFIPIINIITLFCWISMCAKKVTTIGFFIKQLLKMFFWFLLVSVPRIVVSFVFNNPQLDMALTWISIYFYFFAMAWISVEAQEKIMNMDK